MDTEDWVSPGIDVDRPSAARIYDYHLDGGHNFRADRHLAEQTLAIYPQWPLLIQANRAFLRRAVRFLVAAGVRQFLDIGSGIPTAGHVHEVARQARRNHSDIQVVYVDIDPVAVAHSREIFAGDAHTAVVQEDVRRPERILDAPEVARLFDLTQPVAVLVVALLHYLSDADDPAGLLSRLTAPLVAGSYLVISHPTAEGAIDAAAVKEIYRRGGIELTLRNRAQVQAFFATFALIEPGLVWVPEWRPESPDAVLPEPAFSSIYGGVGRKL
jgi:hypothetical protein